jgi:formate-dependent phosphoribosylglycinamide formyltransferase (GAR transformylase)
MTREAFIAEIEAAMVESLAAMQARGYDVVPCTCADPSCPKWRLERVR